MPSGNELVPARHPGTMVEGYALSRVMPVKTRSKADGRELCQQNEKKVPIPINLAEFGRDEWGRFRKIILKTLRPE